MQDLSSQAESLLDQAQAGDEEALRRVGPWFGDPRRIGLRQAELVIAREHGFSSWANLQTHVSTAVVTDTPTGDQLANRFLSMACLRYDPSADGTQFDEARELLRQHPEIADENIYTACVIGDTERVTRWLDRSPSLVHACGGHYHWAPLMYAAYARLPGTSTLAVGQLLLERGADANTRILWNGQYDFSVLTGVFGHGEGGPIRQPEHPDTVAFARALLDAGADPNDSQAAYNRMFEPDDTCLELLLEYGLSGTARNNWTIDGPEGRIPHPSETLHFQLICAIHRGYAERVRLLLPHVDINKPDDSYDTVTLGKTPLEAALILGRNDIAELLRQQGAEPAQLSSEESLYVAIMSANRKDCDALLAESPSLIEVIEPCMGELACNAITTGNRDALEVMIALGFELNAVNGRPPLHEAALSGDLAMVQMLVEAGADTARRESSYLQPAVGFALHAGHAHVVQYLDTQAMDIFTSAARGLIANLDVQLQQDPTLLECRFESVRPVGGDSSRDWMTPLAYAVFSNQIDAARRLLEAGADVNIHDHEGRALIELVRAQGSADMVAFLETLD